MILMVFLTRFSGSKWKISPRGPEYPTVHFPRGLAVFCVGIKRGDGHAHGNRVSGRDQIMFVDKVIEPSKI